MEPQKTNPNDTGGFGVGLLGFIFPIIGLVLYLVWKDNKPISANAAGTGALIGFVVEVIFFADIIAAFLWKINLTFKNKTSVLFFLWYNYK